MSFQKINARTLATAALLVALNIILTRFLSIMIMGNTQRVSLGLVPLMLSGMFFGPVVGGITGIVADLTGLMLNPQGSMFLGYTLSSCLCGVLPGLVFMLPSVKRFPLWKVILSVVIVSLISSLFLNTLWSTLLQGKVFFAILPLRAVVRCIVAPIEMSLCFLICRLYFRQFANNE